MEIKQACHLPQLQYTKQKRKQLLQTMRRKHQLVRSFYRAHRPKWSDKRNVIRNHHQNSRNNKTTSTCRLNQKRHVIWRVSDWRQSHRKVALFSKRRKMWYNRNRRRKRGVKEEVLFYEKQLKQEINEDRADHGKKPLKSKAPPTRKADGFTKGSISRCLPIQLKQRVIPTDGYWAIR